MPLHTLVVDFSTTRSGMEHLKQKEYATKYYFIKSNALLRALSTVLSRILDTMSTRQSQNNLTRAAVNSTMARGGLLPQGVGLAPLLRPSP